MRVAVLGVAHVHADQLLEISKVKTDFDVIGIWDHDGDRADAFAKKYSVKSFHCMDELLDKGLEGVFVFSENKFHHDICIKAAGKVKNILCEKPLATTIREAKEMIQACKDNGVNLRNAYNNRFTASAIQAKELISSGAIGKVTGISGTNHGNCPGGWFVDPEVSGGGSMIDHTVHLADLACWLTGLKPESVFASSSTVFNDIPVEDCGSMVVELTGGVPLTIDFSWSRPSGFVVNGDNKLQIDGTNGTLIIDNRGETVEFGHGGKYTIQSYSKNAYDEMLNDFVRSFKGEDAWGCEGEECLMPVCVVDAAYESVRTGKVACLKY